MPNENNVTITELTSDNRYFSRIEKLREFFIQQFAVEPDFYVRVPGRVNIIGEHVDYCGYPVLPMAIEQCIILAVSANNGNSFLYLRNLESEKFANFKCDLKDLSITLPQHGAPEWYKYFLCGVKGIYELLDSTMHPIGLHVALSGNVPPASGLSSSSALVSAAALATAKLHGVPLERKRLAATSAKCERYIGTQGGGMDQAIAFLAKSGCAQFIEFYPELKATPIQLPAGACFVVANSLAEVNKAASSDFNERVVECRLACRLIAKRQNVTKWRTTTHFAHLQELLQCSLVELEQLSLELLPKDDYERQDICQELQVTADELEREFLTANTTHMQHFKLRQRTLHVLQESIRVQQFRATCENQEISQNGVTSINAVEAKSASESNGSFSHLQLQTLGKLMRQSHESLKTLYECSHEDLDRLIDISEEMGVSARLTGAGWGGCIVALCESMDVCSKYIAMLKQRYFSLLPPHLLEKHQSNDFASVIFTTCPCSGAEILTSQN